MQEFRSSIFEGQGIVVSVFEPFKGVETGLRVLPQAAEVRSHYFRAALRFSAAPRRYRRFRCRLHCRLGLQPCTLLLVPLVLVDREKLSRRLLSTAAAIGAGCLWWLPCRRRLPLMASVVLTGLQSASAAATALVLMLLSAAAAGSL